MPRVERALAEVARVLRPGGVLAAAVWMEEAKVPFFKVTKGLAAGARPALQNCAALPCPALFVGAAVNPVCWAGRQWSPPGGQATPSALPVCALCPSPSHPSPPLLPSSMALLCWPLPRPAEYDESLINTAASVIALRFGDPSELLAGMAAAGLAGVQCEGVEVEFHMPPGLWW